ncbi:hypothetical protein [uncultured Eubacterium sp.]|uniref:hypothetical protein n=1 Tax=uncultured Eubacterium sp. TaxID=165185 RepID=UPI0025944E03|nr:hypothetical protein [uncultured Eubacterium sp.]
MKLETYNTNYGTTFGGIVNESDFCTCHSRPDKSRSWADRVASDLKFDEYCKRAAERTKTQKKFNENKEKLYA